MYTYCGLAHEPSIDVRQHSESAACLNGETRTRNRTSDTV